MKDPTLRQRFADLGAEHRCREPSDAGSAERKHLKAEIDRWAPIIKKAGVYAD